MNKQNNTPLGNFYVYSKEVLKALHTLESFMKDKEFRTFAEKNAEEMKKARIPLSFYQYLSELEEIY